ncbi:MAG: flagellar motor protein MotB [Desulfobacteraceae bacterium]|nr:flagellar motor protein MotB [Desulfobacteraceae bacterium]
MAKRNSKGDASAPSGHGWEVIYTGFILIMLCFFIMLCSLSKVEKVKMRKFVKSFVDSVDIFKGEFGFKSSREASDAMSEAAGLERGLGPIVRQLVEIRDRFGLQNEVTFALSAEGLVMQVSDSALFDRGVAEISSKAFPFLNMIADIISKSTHNVRVEGHTDNLPIHTAKFPSNWDLSTTRAVKVLRYLINKGKCSSQRLSAAGFGEFQPVFPNDTAEHRAKNRRVELVFVPEE